MGVMLPTLHLGATKILTTPADIAAYLIRFLLNNPGRTSEYHEIQLLSLRKRIAEYEDDMITLARNLQIDLNGAMNRFFPNQYTFSVVADITEAPLYKLTIDILDTNGQHLLTGSTISIRGGIITLEGTTVTPEEV